MIAVVIFSVVVLSLAGLSFQIAKRGTRATDQAISMAAQKAAVDKASTVPYDSLAAVLTADTTYSSTMRIIAKYVIDSVSTTTKNVRVIVSSTVAGNKPDTLTLVRGRARYPVPLK